MHRAFWWINLKERDHVMHRWKGNIKIDLKVLGCEGMDWIFLVRGRDGWSSVVTVLTHLPGGVGFLNAASTFAGFLKKRSQKCRHYKFMLLHQSS